MYLQVFSNEDQFKDMERRRHKHKGDLTRPLKNKKVLLLYKVWWSEKSNYVWLDHEQTYTLAWSNVQCLLPNRDLETTVVDGYVELLRRREELFHGTSQPLLFPPCKRFFIAHSFFMSLAINEIKDLAVILCLPNCILS